MGHKQKNNNPSSKRCVPKVFSRRGTNKFAFIQLSHFAQAPYCIIISKSQLGAQRLMDAVPASGVVHTFNLVTPNVCE